MARVRLKSTNVGTLYCDWSSSQDVAKNRSTVTLKLIFQCSSGTSIGPWSDVAGSYLGTTSMTFDGSIPNFSGTRTLATKTMTVDHDSDGTGSATIYWKWGVNSSWGGYVKPSGSFKITLPTIPRASIPTLSASSVEMGDQVTIYTNRASSAFTHTIKFKFGSYSATIATGVTTSYTYDTQLAMASYVPNATSGTGTFTLYTYNGSTLIGTKTVNITLTVPASIVPSISGASTTEANSAVTMGFFVQNQSRINVSITAGGAYGSSITDCTSTFEGKTYKGQSFTIQSVPVSGDRTLTVTVKDSRGRTKTYSRTISVTAYAKPAISAFSAFRCDASGAEDDGGSYVKCTYSFNITSLSNKNGHTVKIQRKLSTASNWTDLTTIGGYSASGATYLSGAVFDPNHSYNVRLYVADTFNSTTKQLDIGTETVTVDYLAGGQGMGLGKVAELEDTLDVAWDGRFRQNVEVDGELKVNGNLPLVRRIPPNLPSDVLYYRAYCSETNIDTNIDKYWCMIDSTNTWWRGIQVNGAEVVTWERIRTYFNFLNFYSNQSEYNKQNGTRKGYIGYPSEAYDDLYISNEMPGANVRLRVKGSVNMAGEVALNPSYPAFHATEAFAGSLYLGISSSKWRAVYATNGTIQTSDRRLKHDINPLEERYIKLFNLLKPVSYIMNDGERTHIGFISQDVEEAMQEVGLTDLEFAGFCKDKKQKEVEIKGTYIDENGEEKEKIDRHFEDVLDEDGNPEYTYSLRYEEFIALNTRMIQDLMAKVEDQQKIIDEQNKRLETLEAEILAIKDLSGSFFDR